MTDLVQVIIQIQKKQPEIKNLKGLAKFVFDNLNPRNFGTYYGVLDTEILDFLKMYGLDNKQSDELLSHLAHQGFMRCVYRYNQWRDPSRNPGIYNLIGENNNS